MRSIPLAAMIILLISALPLSVISSPEAAVNIEREMEMSIENTSMERDHFVTNEGQLSRDDIQFYTIGPFRAGFTDTSVVFALLDPDEGMFSYEMEFVGARRVDPSAEDPESTYYNYMIGEKERWVSGVHCYKRIVYEDLWDGIDIVFSINDGMLKYDIIIEPGANPNLISFKFLGLEDIDINSDGDLLLRTPFGIVEDAGLVSLQGNEMIPTKFDLKGDIIRFDVGRYDETKPLIIDPYVQYCTYLGGNNYEEMSGSSTMTNGDMILVGGTYSSDFPKTAGVIDRTFLGGSEAFITRMKGDLGSLDFSTYIGGSSEEICMDLDLDLDGNIYITGTTVSKNFPITSGVFNETSKIQYVEDEWGWEQLAPDVFVSKISSDGKNLVYSTFIAGNNTDYAVGIAVDRDGFAFVTSTVKSGDLPIKNAYDANLTGYYDYYIIKLNQNASDLEWATYLGGNDDMWSEEKPTDISLTPSNDIVISGISAGMDFPTTSGAFKQSTNSRWMTGTLTGFDSDGDLDFSTFIHEDTQPISVRITSDSIFLTGYTYMSDFPVTKDAYQSMMSGYQDAFMIEFNRQGSIVKYGTFLGGSNDDIGNYVDLDSDGKVMVCGYTSSTDFPLSEYPIDSSSEGYYDAFAAIFNQEKDDLEFSSYFGGNDYDIANWMGFDDNEGLYLSGFTYSSDLPVHEEAYDDTFNNGDLFICRIKIYSFPPSKPLSLSVERGDQELTLLWSPPLSDGNESITGYNIYMSPLNRTFELVGEVNATTTTFFHQDLDNGERYYYYMTAENMVGESPPSKIVVGIPARPPSAPEFTSYSTGDSSVTLDWKDPEDLGGDIDITFNIYRGKTLDGLVSIMDGFEDFSFTDEGLVNGQVYYYAMSATNGMGEGPLSNPIPLKPLKKPDAPENLTTKRGPGYVHLYWNPPLDNGGEEDLKYNIYIGTGGSVFSTKAVGIKQTNLNLTDLINGVHYLFMVSAVNDKGEGPQSLKVGSRPIGIPSEPRELSVVAGEGKADLKWRAPSDLGGDDSVTYNVYVSGPDDDESVLFETGIDDSEYKMSGLVNGQTYSFHVTASNEYMEGPISEIVTATPLGPPSVPREILITGGNGEVTISWSQPSDDGGDPLLSYMVYIGSSQADLSNVGETSGLIHHEKGLVNGRTYYVAVRAFNSYSMSDFSEVRTIIPLSIPGMPEILLTTSSDGEIKFDWKPPMELGGVGFVTYNIYLAPDGSSLELLESNISTTSYMINGLENGVEYTVTVSATNIVGEGPMSDPAREIPVSSPGTPLELVISSGNGFINISWTLPEDNGGSPFTAVEISRWIEGRDPQIITTVPAGKGSYIDENVKEGVRYNYKIVGVTSVGKTPDSEVLSVKAGSTSDNRVDLFLILTISIAVLLLILMIVVLMTLRREKKEASSMQMPPHTLQQNWYPPLGREQQTGQGIAGGQIRQPLPQSQQPQGLPQPMTQVSNVPVDEPQPGQYLQ